jgi:hypothetical protein
MTEPIKTPTPAEQPQVSEFVLLVMRAFEQKNIKPKCSCGCIGWANFEVFPAPSITQIAAPNTVTYSALIHCVKCGLKTERNLNLLGITLEQRKVLTASEVAAQQKKPLIVTG